MTKSKIILLLCAIFIVVVVGLFGYVINKNVSPEKKKCRNTLKQCYRDADVKKKLKLKKCLEERISCGKEKKSGRYCRKQARNCISGSIKDGSNERKQCSLLYRLCLGHIVKPPTQ